MSEQEAISESQEEMERLQAEVDAVRERRRRNWAPDTRTPKEKLLDELESVSEKIIQTHAELLDLLAKEQELEKSLRGIDPVQKDYTRVEDETLPLILEWLTHSADGPGLVRATGNANRWVTVEELFRELKHIAEGCEQPYPFMSPRALATHLGMQKRTWEAIINLERRRRRSVGGTFSRVWRISRK